MRLDWWSVALVACGLALLPMPQAVAQEVSAIMITEFGVYTSKLEYKEPSETAATGFVNRVSDIKLVEQTDRICARIGLSFGVLLRREWDASRRAGRPADGVTLSAPRCGQCQGTSPRDQHVYLAGDDRCHWLSELHVRICMGNDQRRLGVRVSQQGTQDRRETLHRRNGLRDIVSPACTIACRQHRGRRLTDAATLFHPH